MPSTEQHNTPTAAAASSLFVKATTPETFIITTSDPVIRGLLQVFLRYAMRLGNITTVERETTYLPEKCHFIESGGTSKTGHRSILCATGTLADAFVTHKAALERGSGLPNTSFLESTSPDNMKS